MSKYHIALSFAGEDRDYVDRVATHLRENGVEVFYDKFEETKLWGKDLYTYLTDIYQNRALYTVMFVSEAYKEKLWTNHERKSAQARAFTESQEYILPAMFDESVEIPGLLKTTGYISLRSLSPEELGDKIINKLKDSGVTLKVEENFNYSNTAKADIDFPLVEYPAISEIIVDLKSSNWYTQNPAINKIFKLDLDALSDDELFVLGRNIYQTACGGEKKANDILDNLRREMAALRQIAAEHLINGMFYEVYFDSKGEFRGRSLKSRCLDELLEIQSVEKYSESISFIKRVLQPYKDQLPVIPNSNPEILVVDLDLQKKDPPTIEAILVKGQDLLIDAEEDSFSNMWKLSFREFSLETLKETLSREWHVPEKQIELRPESSDTIKYAVPKGKTIGYPSPE
ncbi:MULTISPECIES: TIR domain-containing protein [unclassified Marinobacter]|uniref:toll/interleukin-1 receptor domain-containing protein n=1 Tax=unclassified Marinobacter TaxID=83889 RepID=UPI00200D63B3|nr:MULTISPECIES: TIR domain-containing protein [unclassified Marinobacter]UQG55126.1 TIR domain-containing protein [Marinobacter sp. M4C]UQG63928.1 TIR domain-containing protein [Marinobacter sp. M2C]UQG68211.1 TIR domain-containing protein [Marinobacter sp. M1C]